MTNANDLQFVDTNILIYAYDTSSAEKYQRARKLLAELWDTKKGCLSIQVLQEFYVTLTQKIPNPLPSEKTLQIINALGQWQLHQPGLNSVLEAIHIQQRNRMSFWDAMIIRSAKEIGCTVIWTENLNTGQLYEGIRAENPL